MKAVLTTINSPTESIRKLEEMFGEDLFIIGDQKTPEYSTKATFVPIDEQGGFNISKVLPTNSYTRKNIGYLIAMNDNDLIYETDDDNYLRHLSLPVLEGRSFMAHGSKFINYLTWFSDELIWPRGLPLHFASEEYLIIAKKGVYPIQQRLVEKNPDVDALHRIAVGGEYEFKDEPDLAICPMSYAPFNSQNTWWFRSAFPLMYLPSTCEFRMTDIWRGYIAQRILHARGEYLLISAADAIQDRNEHDLVDDLRQEMDGYLRSIKFCDVLDSVYIRGNIFTDLYNCYTELIRKGFFDEREVEILNAWIKDCENEI